MTKPLITLSFLVGSFVLSSALLSAQDQRLQAAHQAYLLLKDDEALSAVNEILIDEPLNPAALELRARCLIMLGRYPDALKSITRLGDEMTVMQKMVLAECLALNAKDEEALDLLDEVLLEDAMAMEPRIKRAKILIKQGEYQKAYGELQQVIQTDAKNAEALLSMAMIQEGMRRFPDALRIYQRLINESGQLNLSDPHFTKMAVEAMGRVNLNAGRYEQAIDWYGQLVSRFPTVASYRFQLGLSQGMRNKFQDAIANVKQATEMEPNNVGFRIRLAELYHSQKRLDEAIAEFEHVLTMVGDPRLSSLRLAEMYLEKGVLAKAVSNAELVMGLAPESADVQEVMGKVKEKLGDEAAAKACYRKAFELDKLHFQAMYRLGVLLANSEDAAEVEEGTALLDRYQRVSEFRADLDLVRAELSLSPNNRNLYIRLSAILNAAWEYELAGEWMNRGMQMGPPTTQMFAIAGCIMANMKRNEDAREMFQKALDTMGPQKDPKVLSYVQKIDAGEDLPLPLGELVRPTTQKSGDGKPPSNGQKPR